MPWNGAGVFNRVYSWVADKAAGLDISSSRMDQDTNDITANGFGNSLTRDGQGQPTANLPMNGFRHTGVQNAIARTDYAAFGQVQDGLPNWTVAGGSADALTATYTPALASLADGQLCFLRATAANATTTPTFAPNGLTAHTITKIGGAALQAGDISGNLAELILKYNAANTHWEFLNPPATLVSGATSLRPGSPAEGTTRYNTSLHALEYWNGTAWIVTGLSPTIQLFTTGSGTYTPSTGTVRIRVRMVGGGGGGGGGGGASTGGGGSGGSTNFASWVAGGGAGGNQNNVGQGGGGGVGASGGANGTGTQILRIGGGGGGSGASSNTNYTGGIAGAGGGSAWGGAGQAGLGAIGSTGGGGAGGTNGSIGAFGQGGGGGGGEYVEFYVTSPVAVSYVVGAAGIAGTAGTGSSGNAGAAGRIVIEELYQ